MFAFVCMCAASPVIPINDIRGVETFGYTKQEKVLRCKLAGCYRLVDLFGWTHGIFNHISVSLHAVHPVFCMLVGRAVQVKLTAGRVCHILTLCLCNKNGGWDSEAKAVLKSDGSLSFNCACNCQSVSSAFLLAFTIFKSCLRVCINILMNIGVMNYCRVL